MYTTRDGVFFVRFKKTGVKYWVDVHCGREGEFEDEIRFLGADGEWTETSVVQLLGGSQGFDIETREPHFVSFFEGGGFRVISIIETSMSLVGEGDHSLKFLGDGIEVLYECFCSWD